MMYSNNLAVAVKHSGQILRERQETVYLPFGSEYSILIKNLNTVRASVKVYIDGIDATDEVELVIDPGQDLELERFIRGGNLGAGNRFRFIEKTDYVQQTRKSNIEDGLIRVEFQFEQINQFLIPPYHVKGVPYNPDGYYRGGLIGSAQSVFSANSICHDSYTTTSATATPEGVTAPGSVSHQEFSPVSGFALQPQKHSIILKLAGQATTGVVTKKITKPVTVKTTIRCGQCGKSNKARANFCERCGSSLQLV